MTQRSVSFPWSLVHPGISHQAEVGLVGTPTLFSWGLCSLLCSLCFCLSPSPHLVSDCPPLCDSTLCPYLFCCARVMFFPMMSAHTLSLFFLPSSPLFVSTTPLPLLLQAHGPLGRSCPTPQLRSPLSSIPCLSPAHSLCLCHCCTIFIMATVSISVLHTVITSGLSL